MVINDGRHRARLRTPETSGSSETNSKLNNFLPTLTLQLESQTNQLGRRSKMTIKGKCWCVVSFIFQPLNSGHVEKMQSMSDGWWQVSTQGSSKLIFTNVQSFTPELRKIVIHSDSDSKLFFSENFLLLKSHQRLKLEQF